jgi:1-acyl-sn-glycerol-3-phosphate acyltransferase
MYATVNFLIGVFIKAVFLAKMENREKEPKDGAFIVCANHGSNWDALAVCTLLKRKVHFMAKKEMFQNVFSRRFFLWSGAFPVDRAGADVSAVKNALKVLKEGKTLAMFPQGTRARGDRAAADLKAGAVMLAARAGVPILPVSIRGAFRLFGKVRLILHDPVFYEKDADIDAKTKELMEGILKNAN